MNNTSPARSSSPFENYTVASFPYLIIALAIAWRFLPHVWNFTPIGAMLLLAGASLPARRLWVPLAAIMASDLILTRYVYRYSYGGGQYFVWLGWAAMLALGLTLRGRGRDSAWRIGISTVAGSLSFFLLSNFGVWAAGWYTHTVAGLRACYIAGLPFYRQSAAGDLLFSAAFFATYAWLRRRQSLRLPSAA